MSARPSIYMDNLATTPLDPRVLEAMLPFLREKFGNAASQHRYGWEAEAAVKAAARQVLALLGGERQERELVWTSGATEADNLAIQGVAEAQADRGRHLVTCATEHRAVLDPMEDLARRGWELTVLPVDGEGALDPQRLAAALRPDTVLVSLMAANNETGAIHPLATFGPLIKAAGALFHVDAAQAFGKIPLDVDAMGIDLLSLSAHKIYGPKGVGALWVRSRPKVRLAAQIHGGGHQGGRRSGTLNVAGIVGLGKAAALCHNEMTAEAERLGAWRDRLAESIQAKLADVTLNGPIDQRLPGCLNLSFGAVNGENLLMGLRDLALSSGSACSSADPGPSHVLLAMGLDRDLAHSSLRFGLGRFNTKEEVDEAADRVVKAVTRLRDSSPVGC